MSSTPDFHGLRYTGDPRGSLRPLQCAVIFPVFILLLTLCASAAEPTRLDPALFGKTIRSIAISSDLPIDRAHYEPYLGIKAGDLLTRTGMKDAIQFLYECGRFSHVGV